MQETVLLSTAGVVVVSCLVALAIDHLLPARPKVKRVLPIIGITVSVTNRFMAIWIASGLVVFVLSVAIGVRMAQPATSPTSNLTAFGASQLQNKDQEKKQKEEAAKQLAEDNPYLSKDDIILFGDELSKRNLSGEQAKKFTYEIFDRGVTLLNANEQEEVARIRKQLFSTFSPEDSSKVTSIYERARTGQPITTDEVEHLRVLQKNAINNLPDATKARFQFLMGKALRAALKTQ